MNCIGHRCFWGCKGLKSVTILNNDAIIEAWAFTNCSNLEFIRLPEHLQEIRQSTFHGCEKLENLRIPSKIERIGDGAFAFCKSLKKISIPNSLKRIEEYAFSACENLSIVSLTENIEIVGDKIFNYCKLLDSIHIPHGTMSKFRALLPEYFDKLVEIDDSETLSTAVTEEDLKNAWTDEYGVKYSNDRKRLLKALSDRFSTRVVSPVVEYSIKEGTEIICDGAFYHYQIIKGRNNYIFPSIDPTIKQIIIPDSVTKIGNYAFAECKELTSIMIPGRVDLIGTCAFYGCKNLTSIYISDSITNFGGNYEFEYGRKINGKDSPFIDCPNLRSIFIPKGSLSKFKNLLPSYKKLLVETQIEIYNWKLKNIRYFYEDEIRAVKSAIVVDSKYGHSICFNMNNEEKRYIPLCNQSRLAIGDIMDMKTAKFIILSREGEKDIYRVLE